MVQAKASNKLATDVSVSFVQEPTVRGKRLGCLPLIWRMLVFTEALQGEGRKREAQLHAERRSARDASGQAERQKPERGKRRLTLALTPCATCFLRPTRFLHLLTDVFRAHTRNPG